MSSSSEPKIDGKTVFFSDPSMIDPANLVVEDPKVVKVGAITTVLSSGFYMCEDGVERTLYFSAPTQKTFGPSYVHEMNVPDDEKTKSNATGIQIQYPTTSLQTITTPTPDEEAFISAVDALYEKVSEKYGEEIEKAATYIQESGEKVPVNIPYPSYSAGKMALQTGDWSLALKPPCDYSKGKDGKLDSTKPKKMYVKLITTGKGDKMRVSTNIYTPDHPEGCPIHELIGEGIRGDITPVFRWDGVYWGAHGPSPYGASLRLKLAEANFELSEGASQLPKSRLLPGFSGTSRPKVEEVESEEGTFAPVKSKALAGLVKPKATPAKAAPAKATPKAKAVPVTSAKATPAKATPKARAAPVTPAKATPAKVAPKAKPKAAPAKEPALAKPKIKMVAKPPPPPEEDLEEEAEEEVVEEVEGEVEEEVEAGEEEWDE